MTLHQNAWLCSEQLIVLSLCVENIQEALLMLVDGCPQMNNFRAAYATVSVQFIRALGNKWGGDSKTGGLTQLDLSFCKTAAADDVVAMCETLAHALGQCSRMRTLALAGFAAMRQDAVPVDDTELSVYHPADVVIETVLTSCLYLENLNCSETNIGAGAIASALLQLRSSEHTTFTGEGQAGILGLTCVNFSGCRRLGGETFVTLLRTCPELRDLNLGYCCNEDHAQVAIAEARGRARAHAFGPHKRADPASISVDTRVITDNDLNQLPVARCANKLQGLRLGGMGSRTDVPWPTVGGSVNKAFSNNGVSAALTGKNQRNRLPALQIVDLSHSAVTNSTIVGLALSSPHLSRLNIVGSKCTRELHRMLREAGCSARVYGI